MGVDEYLPGVSDNTSLRVVFNERIDGTTVSADDFSVDGAAPTDAQWSGTGDTSDGDATRHWAERIPHGAPRWLPTLGQS